jgi:hypothetical protein
MKFSIRDLFLVTMIVALAVGWWVVDRSRLAARYAQGEESFRKAMTSLSFEIATEHDFDTPSGLWTVNRTRDAAK